jgi:hypothetical protein
MSVGGNGVGDLGVSSVFRFHGVEPNAVSGPEVSIDIPAWPSDDTIAVWLVLGQSNADGWAPYEQDPDQSNPANAVAALSASERLTHDWVLFTPSGSVGATTVGKFSKRGLATAGTPRTSSKVWTAGANGIPNPTPTFGVEVGLIKHVLTDFRATNWRDDTTQRLYVLKGTYGGTSVDQFRNGAERNASGDRRNASLLSITQTDTGTTLTSLAGSKTVYIQGITWIIGEADANNNRPDTGASMAASFAQRFEHHIREVRGAFGLNVPIAFVEILDNGDSDRDTIRSQLATLATSVGNATVLSAPTTSIGDGTHFDAAAMIDVGQRVFAHFRDNHGRAGDGLVTDYEFTGVMPYFEIPPVLIDDSGTNCQWAVRPSSSGTVHYMVLSDGSAAPTATEVSTDAAVTGKVGYWSRSVTASTQDIGYSGSSKFTANTTEDVYAVLEDGSENLSEVYHVVRGGNVKFGPDPAATPAAGGDCQITLTRATAGSLYWVLYEGTFGYLGADDVKVAAQEPVQAGIIEDHSASYSTPIDLTGLTGGQAYTFIISAFKTTGDPGETKLLTFTGIA